MSDQRILDAGFDHPCRQTCSGWTQGRSRGVFNENRRLAELLELDALAIESLAFMLDGVCEHEAADER